MLRNVPALVGLLLFAPVGVTAAAPLGRAGQAAVGVERVFGYSYARGEGDGVTALSLFGSSGVEAFSAPYALPRFGVDYFPIAQLSVGVAGGYARLSSRTVSSATEIIGVYPRLGYALPLGEDATFWPRIGASFVSLGNTESANRLLAVSVELQLLTRLGGSLAVSVVPTADVGVMGTNGHTVNQFGCAVGLVGWF